jgi:hypothetical protein
MYYKLVSHLIRQKQTVLVLEENQSLENALRRLLQELVVSLFITEDCGYNYVCAKGICTFSFIAVLYQYIQSAKRSYILVDNWMQIALI